MSYTLQCPKCHAMMRTYNRNGIQIEQCDGCRGIFLDYGELEALTRLEAQWSQPGPPPPAPPYAQPGQYAQPGAYPQQSPYPQPGQHAQPAWGHGHGNRSKHGGFARMLFSS
ncbi:TFIIB-type zinc ribbon-containing protein [Frankia sp. AgKG'84/4]|uniref:TFIIB-type zinc ribbon-containing protein n=1 Tax=Frankia sp. AgKG'84/4 TaxID=573490 RepID=UPI00200E28BE|nr:zf-TFIIB domain-containing protein [Frankia sp. AgKG'84/4]MCL9797971.1 zf-TFIIB domain-containing protein [Frankia sp. AgKG'84/4]